MEDDAVKRFLYLVQVEHELPGHLRDLEADDSDVRFLSWKTRSPDPRSVFYPQSSWTEGRNRLYKEIEGTSYEYYIFIDDDVEMRTRCSQADNGWRAFEAFLLDYQPAVGVPKFDWHLRNGGLDVTQPVQGIRFFDAVVNAFHHEAVHTLLPYCDLLDRYSESYSQSVVCSLAAELYPGHLLQYNEVEVVNLLKRRLENESLYCRAEELFLESVRDPGRYAQFQRLRKGPRAVHRPFGVPRWKERSYVIPADELERRFDTGHRMWTRRQELVELSPASEYFGERADTDRARAWQAVKASRVQRLPWRVRMRLSVREAIHWVLRRCPPLDAVNRSRVRSRDLPWKQQDRRRRTLTPSVARAIAAQWERWRLGPETVYDAPDMVTAWRWVGGALRRTTATPLTMIDAGGLRQDTVRALIDVLPRWPVMSVGISATPHPQYLAYSEYATAAVSSGPEDPSVPQYRLSTLVRQFGLEDQILHLISIDDQASNLEALLSLDRYTAACLFLHIRMSLADRARVEALGFRLFAVAGAASAPGVDCIFVNDTLFTQLIPPPVQPAP